jgi:C1A family cysteine protease
MAKIDQILDTHWQTLRVLGNVLNLNIAEEITGGKKTGRAAITLYVKRKLPLDTIAPEHRAPEMLDGIPVDVVEIDTKGKWIAGETSISKLHPAKQKNLLGLQRKPKMFKTRVRYGNFKIADLEVDYTTLCQLIQNQKQCGSCTAFGSTGIAEASFKQTFGVDVKLSEQHAFTCSGGTCSGGNTIEAVLDFLVQGCAIEADLPYSLQEAAGVDQACGLGLPADWYTRGKMLASRKALTDIDSIRAALAIQPLVTGMDVQQSFMNYVSGVYTPGDPSSDPVLGGHCIGCVGASDTKKAYKGRNSWGNDGWGEAGYFWIAYGACGFDSEMYALTPSNAPVPAPAPTPTPTPQPCWLGRAALALPNLSLKKTPYHIYIGRK